MDIPDAFGHVQPTVLPTMKPLDIPLIAHGGKRRSQERHVELSPVRVTTKQQIPRVLNQVFFGVGIVDEDDRRSAFHPLWRSKGLRRVEVARPNVSRADQIKLFVVDRNDDGPIEQQFNAAFLEQIPHFLSLRVTVVLRCPAAAIVVAQAGEGRDGIG